MSTVDAPEGAMCTCPACVAGDTHPENMVWDDGRWVDFGSLDPDAGGTYAGKEIWDVATITANLNRTEYDWYTNNYGELDDGVLNFGFWKTLEQLQSSYYVTPDGSVSFNEAYYGGDFSAFTAGQITIARNSMVLWDDIISIKVAETGVEDADITFGNTYTGGAQAYAYLPFGDVYDSYYEDLYGFEEAGRLGGDVWIDGYVPSN